MGGLARLVRGAGAGRGAPERPHGEGGYAMAALLVGMAIMAVVMSAAMPVWSTMAKRVKEDELVFRGEQYAHAIALYQRKYANALPPSIDVLVNERFLRKKYLDPMTGQAFQPLTGAVGQASPGAGAGGRGASGIGGGTSASGGTGFQLPTQGIGRGTTGIGAGTASQTGSPFGGAGGIMGVASKSKEKSLRLYNGRDVYSEWSFVAVQRQVQAGAGGEGQAAPGLPGGRGQPTPGQPNQGTRGTGSGRSSSPFGR